MVVEKLSHLLFGLEVLLTRVNHTVRVGELRARREREKDIVRVVVLLLEEVDVVRRNDADAELLSERDYGVCNVALAGVELVELVDGRRGNLLTIALALPGRMQHHLERIVVAEELLVPKRDLLGLLRIVAALERRVEVVGDLPRDTGRRAVKPLVVLLKKLVVDSRVVVVAVDVRLRDEPHEIVVADEVLRVKAQVEALLLQFLVLAEELVALAVVVVYDVRLYAEDRLYALLPRLVVERLRGKHVAVVRDGKRGHAERLRLGDERHDAALPVKQGVSRMQVEMREAAHGVYYTIMR